MLYSIIDIEATGGNAKNGKITEVAIYTFDGLEIVAAFDSLVNPGMGIPPYVQRLTGINNKMAAAAPTFAEIAPKVASMLSNSCFVAHNVKADYSFIQAELFYAGIEFKSNRLCTLELSKRLIPEAPSHGLGKICDYLNIQIPDQHRATGDAIATVELFKILKQRDQLGIIEKLIRKA